MGNFLDDLSDVQREAVCYNDGPSLVVAGAGSGKTRVLTYKIAELIEEGLKPSSILALTFTNKAAKEMKSRIANLVGEENSSKLWMGTFHSIFSRILRKEAETLGFSSDFTIYNTSDSQSLIKTIIKEMKLDDKVYSPRKLLSRISQLKNDLVTYESYRNRAIYHEEDIKNRMPLFGDIYRTYCTRCKRANAMDFDDLLMNTNILFRDNANILAKYQNIYKFILVDEYQDTNLSQFLIVQKLASKSKKVCVVGDDAQSIYSFRGARIENILKFQQYYPGCKVFKLEQNYRSTKNIVRAASSLIKKNENQLPKNVFSEQQEGSQVAVISSYSEVDECNKITALLKELKNKCNFKYSDFAILYRTNAQSYLFEKTMRMSNIPYKIYGSTSFYEHKEIQDLLGYFRVIINAKDDEALKRIINYPTRGIGDTTLQKILDTSNRNGVSAMDVISDPLTYKLEVNGGTLQKLATFKALFEEFTSYKDLKDAFELADLVIHKSGIWAKLHEDNSLEGKTRLQNVEELMNGLNSSCASKMETEGEMFMLSDFMSEVALMTSQDNDDGMNEKVTLMTVHAAKGLEFKNVFIVGVEEELFPSNMSTGSQEGIEEERRLFYVALTRAEKNCFISYAKSRMRNGSQNQTNPSRFIRDIDIALLNFDMSPDLKSRLGRMSERTREETWNEFRPKNDFKFSVKPKQETPKYHFSEKQTAAQRNLEQSLNKPKISVNSAIGRLKEHDFTGIHVGSKVEHAQFGLGTVISLINPESNMCKVIISFENVGEKTLILKFANMKLL